MNEEEKEEALGKLDDIIDELNDLVEEYKFPVATDALIKQAVDLLNKAQGKL